MKIPLVDLKAQYASLKPAIDAAIQRVFAKGQFILGPEVEALEQELAAYCGTTHAVAVASGTDALELSLRACGIGPNDEVITSAFSFFATAEAIVTMGAIPVFVDIDPLTFTLDPSHLEAQLTPRTKAVLPVHLYGHPCDMAPLMEFATRHHLAVIEDCAQALGARYRGVPVGSFGRAGCFSFYPSKPLGAYGDGGLVVTHDADLAERLRLLRVHGSREKYVHVLPGKNSRLDELQAAILRAKLPHLEAWTRARRQHAQTYRALFTSTGLTEWLTLPEERPECWHVFSLYVIRCSQRERLYEGLTQEGIGVQVVYPLILPHQPALAFLGSRPERYPVAERAAAEVLALPLYPELSSAQLRRVVEDIQQILGAPKAQKAFDKVP